MKILKSGPVVWITGLSGAGKSSLGFAFSDLLRTRGYPVVILDGDSLRLALQNLLPEKKIETFDRAFRLKLAKTYASIAHEMSSQGVFVVVATVSLFWEVQNASRNSIDDYFEVLLEAPKELLIERRRARAGFQGGDFVGVEIDAEFPETPELIISSEDTSTVEESLAMLTSSFDSWFRGRK